MSNLYMPGLELIHKIVVQEERDFKRIRLSEGFKIEGEEGKVLIQYLKERHKQYYQNPLDFSYASLRNIEAQDLLLPWLTAVETDFSGARLAGCELTSGNFERAIFREANLSPTPNRRITSFASSKLSGANFEKAILQNVYFGYTDLSNANFTSSYLHSADFTKADLCYIHGLESAIDLEHAKIEEVTASEKEKKIILDAKSRQIFKNVTDSHLN